MSSSAAQKDAYMDRFGKLVAPDVSARYKYREGVFAACVSDGHLLVSWSKVTPTVAELPGGGIEPGEELVPALMREIEEETTARIEVGEPVRTLRQDVKYYSDKNHEFWDYHQTYLLLEGAAVDAARFEGERKPEDALSARWVKLEDLHGLTFHAVHKAALAQLGITW
jgi:8-oxo-dGTP pyrophosphatase MutT (NUDIX family)